LRGGEELLIEQLSPERRLALAYAPAPARAATLALLALDAPLGATLQRREPMAVQLRLAWWREKLTELSPAEVNADPVLNALRAWREPACLAILPQAWEVLLADELDDAVLEEFASGRAEAFACLSAELQAQGRVEVIAAGKVWALADLAAHVSSASERRRVVEYGCRLPAPRPLPRVMRPLAVLAGLGYRALQRGGGPLLGGPASTLLALRIGLTGR
jgi:phytoene synthase